MTCSAVLPVVARVTTAIALVLVLFVAAWIVWRSWQPDTPGIQWRAAPSVGERVASTLLTLVGVGVALLVALSIWYGAPRMPCTP